MRGASSGRPPSDPSASPPGDGARRREGHARRRRPRAGPRGEGAGAAARRPPRKGGRPSCPAGSTHQNPRSRSTTWRDRSCGKPKSKGTPRSALRRRCASPSSEKRFRWPSWRARRLVMMSPEALPGKSPSAPRYRVPIPPKKPTASSPSTATTATAGRGFSSYFHAHSALSHAWPKAEAKSERSAGRSWSPAARTENTG